MTSPTPDDLIKKIGQVSHAFMVGSGVPSADGAGMIVSHLMAHPEDIDKFMDQGIEMILDMTISWESGCLAFKCLDGHIRTARQIRQAMGKAEQ